MPHIQYIVYTELSAADRETARSNQVECHNEILSIHPTPLEALDAVIEYEEKNNGKH